MRKVFLSMFVLVGAIALAAPAMAGCDGMNHTKSVQADTTTKVVKTTTPESNSGG